MGHQLLAAVLLLLGLSMLEKDEIFSRVAAKLRQLQTKHYLKLFSSQCYNDCHSGGNSENLDFFQKTSRGQLFQNVIKNWK